MRRSASIMADNYLPACQVSTVLTDDLTTSYLDLLLLKMCHEK